jgi:hypothetical protein
MKVVNYILKLVCWYIGGYYLGKLVLGPVLSVLYRNFYG